MTSTEFNVGLNGVKNSSRVLKPPGGGHSNIFGEAEAKVLNPRPKYDQQNSSNLNFCMNTTDPNKKVEQIRSGSASESAPAAAAPVAQPSVAPEPVVQPSAPVATKPNGQQSAPAQAPTPAPAPAPAPAPELAPAAPTRAPQAQTAPVQPTSAPQGRSRVPPGGFSSGLW